MYFFFYILPSLVFIRLIIFHVQIKKCQANSQLWSPRFSKPSNILHPPLLVLLGLKQLEFKQGPLCICYLFRNVKQVAEC